MEDLGYCSQCRKVLERSHRFCPHCGTANQESLDWETLLDLCLEPLETQEKTTLLERLIALTTQVTALDEEIGDFLKGRSPQVVR